MDKYERILFIDEMLSKVESMEDAPSPTDIRRALEAVCGSIDRSTVWRDIRDLEEKFHAPLDYVDKKSPNGKRCKGLFYTSKAFRVPAMFSTGDKIRSAQLVMRLLDSVRGTPVYDEAAEAFRDLATEAPTVDSRGGMKFGLDSAERIIFIGPPCVDVPEGTWRTVKEAVSRNRRLKFSYHGRDRTVEPYQIIFGDGNWNLWCYDYGSRERRLFTLANMEGARFKTGKDNEFVLPDDFDFRRLTPGYFGTFHSGEDCVVRVRLRGYAAKYAMCRTWGGEQTVERISDDEIRLSFRTSQFPKGGSAASCAGGPILSWILGWGEFAVPEAPAELVDIWRRRVSAMSAALEE